jgi:hypothetical protein
MGDLLGSLIWGAKSGQYCVIGGGSLQMILFPCKSHAVPNHYDFFQGKAASTQVFARETETHGQSPRTFSNTNKMRRNDEPSCKGRPVLVSVTR